MFGDVLERKEAFLTMNSIDFKKGQILHFSIGINPWFLSKLFGFDFSIYYFNAKWNKEKCLV